MTTLDWAEKYRPQTLAGVVGNNKAVEELKRWARQWEEGTPEDRAVVLYGKAGIGKTTAAHALGRDMGWEVIELNASDQRTADIIERVAGSASQNSSLEGKSVKRLIIMDEADNIHGTADRGGERAIIGLIKKTNQPIILIANELYDMSKGLRSACKPVLFSSLMWRSMVPLLRKIAEAEGITYESGVLEKIATGANGDLRSAINDMQAVSQGKSKLETKDIITGDRDTKENIFKLLAKIFKGTDIKEVHSAFFNLDENPEDFIHWIDENLPLEYKAKDDLEKGYNYLSRASLFLGRVRIRQNYNMWRYASVLMTSGIVVAKSHRLKGFTKFQTPSFWRKLGQTKGMRQIRDSTARKIGNHCHVSTSFTRSQLMPFFRILLKDEECGPHIAATLGLEPEEIAFLVESKSITKKVQQIYDRAQFLMEKETEHEIEVFGGFSADKSVDVTEKRTKNREDPEDRNEGKSQSTLFDF